jgi:predicted GNAT family N-acyltransferase
MASCEINGIPEFSAKIDKTAHPSFEKQRKFNGETLILFLDRVTHQVLHIKKNIIMIENKRFTFEDKILAEQAFFIRRKVFVDEQGVDQKLEYDNEEQSNHYLLLVAGKPIATARWRETEKGIKLERFAVLPEFRNRGFGEIILDAVLNDVRHLGKTIYLHSQVRAVSFYERNGFIKEGEMFIEAGIEHYYMKFHG